MQTRTFFNVEKYYLIVPAAFEVETRVKDGTLSSVMGTVNTSPEFFNLSMYPPPIEIIPFDHILQIISQLVVKTFSFCVKLCK